MRSGGFMSRRQVLATTLGVALFFVAAPAAATHTSAHAAEQIRAVVAEAEGDMEQVVSDFEAQISDFEQESQVNSAEDDAKDAIDAIWANARDSIQDLADLYPGELGSEAGTAKQDVQDARQAARTDVSDLADSWTQPTPTTTTPATTTTTTTPATTTTRPTTTTSVPASPGSGAATPPPGANNEGDGEAPPPGSESGGGEPDPSSPPSPGATMPSPGATVPGSALAPLEEPSPDGSIFLASQTSGRAVTFGEADSSIVDARGPGATGRIASLLDTILPPGLVDLVLSPLLILEILIRTIVDGWAAILVPITLLALSAYGIFMYDRHTKRDPFAAGADPGLVA
jgi:hypothetical protein